MTLQPKGDGKWSWCTDSGKWVPYSKEINDKLEEAFYAGEEECEVDDERFVDLVQMLQRRYDDRSRCRAVQREILPPYDQLVVLFLGFTQKRLEELIKEVNKGKGLVSVYLVPKVTHVVCDKHSIHKFHDDLVHAQKMSIPIVSEDYLEEVKINGSRRVDVTKFILVQEPLKPSAAAAITTTKTVVTATTTATAITTTVTASATMTVTATTASTATATTAKSRPKDGILPHTKWCGVYTASNGDVYPVECLVYYRNDDRFLAELRRPTAGNMRSILQGKIDGNTVTISEGAASGSPDPCIKLPDEYSGNLEGKTITCNSVHGASLELSYVQVLRPTKLGWLKPGTVFKGVAYVNNPFELQVSKQNGSGGITTFEGTLSWPTQSQSKTKVKGSITGNEMDMEEYEVVSGEADVPTFYSGQIQKSANQRTINGVYYDEDKTKPLGSFTMNL